MTDFLLSYLESDGPWADWVQDRLVQVGYTVKRHAWNYSDKAPLTQLCDETKQESACLLTVASPAYISLIHNQADWATIFFERKTPVLTVRVKLCTISPQLGWNKVVDIFMLGQDEGKSALLEAAKSVRGEPKGVPIQAEAEGENVPALPSRRRAVYRVGCAMSPCFVGRDTSLTILEQGLQREGIAVVQGTQGHFGLGSSQLVAEYAYRHWADYRVIWWVRAGNPTLINADMSRLANKLGLTEKATRSHAIELKAVMQWMSENSDWLFVFDDATSDHDLQPFLPAQCKGHILITSNDPHWWAVRHRFRLNVLDRSDSIQYLLRRMHEIDESSAAILASEVGDLPLALQLAGSYMLANAIPLSEYVDLFHRQRGALWKDGPPPRSSDFVMKVLLTLSLERIAKENEDALALAKAFLFMREDGIRLNALLAGVKKLPPHLAKVLTSPQSAAKATSVLARYGLIEEADDVFRMHGQVQKQLRQFHLGDPAIEKNKAMQVTLGVFNKKGDDRKKPLAVGDALLHIVQETFPDVYYDAYCREQCAELSGDGITLLDRASELGLSAERAAELAKRIGGYLYYCTCYDAATQVLKRALAFQEKAQGAKHQRAADILTLLGSVRWFVADLVEARSYYEAALQTEAVRKKPVDPEVAKCYQNLGHICQEMGLFVEAKKYYTTTLELHRKIYGDVHKTVAADYTDLGLVAQKLGDTGTAWRHYKDALEMHKEVYGPKHPSISTCIKNFGGLLYSIGDYQGSLNAFRHALKLDEKLYAAGHPELARDHNNLGLVMQQLGNLEEAEKHYMEALGINRVTFGKEHPKLAIQLNNLGSIRQARGDTAGAKEFYAEASKILGATYGEDHPTTIQIAKNISRVDL